MRITFLDAQAERHTVELLPDSDGLALLLQLDNGITVEVYRHVASSNAMVLRRTDGRELGAIDNTGGTLYGPALTVQTAVPSVTVTVRESPSALRPGTPIGAPWSPPTRPSAGAELPPVEPEAEQE